MKNMHVNKNETVDWGASEEDTQKYRLQTLHITKENKGFYITVAWFLGLIVVLSIISISILDYFGKQTPGALIALASVAVGALGNW